MLACYTGYSYRPYQLDDDDDDDDEDSDDKVTSVICPSLSSLNFLLRYISYHINVIHIKTTKSLF